MKILLSPSKTLDYTSPINVNFLPINKINITPRFINHSKKLIKLLKKFSIKDLQLLMSISPKLAGLTFKRIHCWKNNFKISTSVRPAIFAFRGDVYEGINITNYELSQIMNLNNIVVILSGLYGYLTPLTLMQPYRLEMGIKLKTIHGNTLYHFWGDLIALDIEKNMKKNDYFVNLASKEYFKVVEKYLTRKVITPIFKDKINGKYKVVSFWSKKARGLMTTFIIKNKIKLKEDIKYFKESGYFYQDSAPENPLFLRNFKEF